MHKTIANLIIALESLAKAKADNRPARDIQRYQDFMEEKASEARLAIRAHLGVWLVQDVQDEEKGGR